MYRASVRGTSMPVKNAKPKEEAPKLAEASIWDVIRKEGRDITVGELIAELQKLPPDSRLVSTFKMAMKIDDNEYVIDSAGGLVSLTEQSLLEDRHVILEVESWDLIMHGYNKNNSRKRAG